MKLNSGLTAIKNFLRPADTAIVGIDIGTTKISAAVLEPGSTNPQIIGTATVPFNGVSWATANKVSDTAEAIRLVVNEASKRAGCSTRSAVIGISDITTGKNSIGLIRIKKQINQHEMQRAVDAAADFTIPEDMVLLDHIVNSITLDGLNEIKDAQRIDNSSLEAQTHTILCRRVVMEVVSEACRLAGLNVKRFTVSELGAASILLSPEEKEEGVCLLDIGGEYTSIFAYVSGALRYSSSVPWGGNYLTSCIGLQLGIDKSEAEKIKIAYSSNQASICTAEHGKELRDLLSEKLRELCTLLDGELIRKNLKNSLGKGIVLAGGTSMIPVLAEIFERECGRPVRRAECINSIWLDNVPLKYANAVGLALNMAGCNNIPKRSCAGEGLSPVRRLIQTIRSIWSPG